LLAAHILRGRTANLAIVARGKRLEVIRHSGIEVENDEGRFSTPPFSEVSDDPEKLGPCDVVLLTVKAWQVKEVAHLLRPLLAGGGFVVPLQNGVEAYDTLASYIDPSQLALGLTDQFVRITSSGSVKQTGPGPRITVGEKDGRVSERLGLLTRVLTRSGINCVVSDDIHRDLWMKFLFVETMGSLGAVTRARIGQIRDLPETRHLLKLMIAETNLLALKLGIRLGETAKQDILRKIDKVPENAIASMAQDILNGRPSELGEQTGAVVRLAESNGVKVPAHQLIYAALLPQERQSRAYTEGPRYD
jgi:2-dehydropantoate 2-reductase